MKYIANFLHNPSEFFNDERDQNTDPISFHLPFCMPAYPTCQRRVAPRWRGCKHQWYGHVCAHDSCHHTTKMVNQDHSHSTAGYPDRIARPYCYSRIRAFNLSLKNLLTRHGKMRILALLNTLVGQFGAPTWPGTIKVVVPSPHRRPILRRWGGARLVRQWIRRLQRTHAT